MSDARGARSRSRLPLCLTFDPKRYGLVEQEYDDVWRTDFKCSAANHVWHRFAKTPLNIVFDHPYRQSVWFDAWDFTRLCPERCKNCTYVRGYIIKWVESDAETHYDSD